ncbi:hypothetical protein RQP46_009957 [Phenoliferia psychrophenolica]
MKMTQTDSATTATGFEESTTSGSTMYNDSDSDWISPVDSNSTSPVQVPWQACPSDSMFLSTFNDTSNMTMNATSLGYPTDGPNGTVNSVSVFPCERASPDEPCRFRFGANYTISVNFTSAISTTRPRSTVLARDDTVVPSLRYPYSGQSFDGCTYTSCPIVANISQVYTYTMNTLLSMSATLLAYGSRIRDTVEMLIGPWVLSELKVSPVDLTGKNVIVTGANVGIGLECARKLAQNNASVTLACRSAEKGEKAKADIIASTGNQKVDVRVLDTSSFASVRAFAAAWGDKPVDVLLNNAGMTAARYIVSEDGLETSFQVNHHSHFLLVSLLLPVMAPHARIVNLSSIGHYSGVVDPKDIDRSQFLEQKMKLKPGDLMDNKTFIGLYGDAKLCQVVFTRELQSMLDASEAFKQKNIIVSACHPGLVASSIWERHLGEAPSGDAFIAKLKRVVNLIGITTEQGACTPVWLATEPKLAVGGGLYYTRCKESSPSPLVKDAALRKAVWAAWAAKCGVSKDL